ncbi:hypothetical protein [Methylophilus sp.]|jgi:hypothetical protein|uniref:DUF7482 domain-containing protein n=1 Tax=Methylophilus sp. TaxID=29541 RepID=UPI0011D4AD83|nr:hypothetical protein [Methylophilus sp.]TXI44784.1 MAG: hypothetical protein E6Q52_07905 [Methylophilus sp.]
MTLGRLLVLGVMSMLAACATKSVDLGHTQTILPLNHAWVDGKKVEYITTDISDLNMAQSAGINFVPRLREAIAENGGRSILERVYKFPAGEQISIFQSAPSPIGGDNADKNYSPLWRLVLVKWLKLDKIRVLKSEAELLSAEDQAEVSLDVTDIVVNCPVTKDSNGKALSGVR